MTDHQRPLSPRNSTGVVYDAICELHAMEQKVTRKSLAEATGLKMSIIGDRTRALVDWGKVFRLQRGVFEPAIVHPPARPMRKSAMGGDGA